MELKIVSQKNNPLLKRKEVQFQIEHSQSKTPVRLDVKQSLAAQLQVDNKLVYIKKMKTKTGTNITVGNANAYETAEQAKLIEPEYIIKRNNPAQKQAEGAKA
ncbi:MAG: 30S ribosomal protein S24e [Crenarchaeota archaeon]|nr:30S ribosomal protein S24e [Thermoproteota archaeon]